MNSLAGPVLVAVDLSEGADEVFGSYVHFADGTDTHAGRAISFGVSWPFQLR